MSGHHTLFLKKMDWAKGRKERKDADSTFVLSRKGPIADVQSRWEEVESLYYTAYEHPSVNLCENNWATLNEHRPAHRPLDACYLLSSG